MGPGGRVYAPVCCAGLLMRLHMHGIRLIVYVKMGAIANNYGVVALRFAASPFNTTAGRRAIAVHGMRVHGPAGDADDCQ